VQVILRDITERKFLEAQALRNQRMESLGSLAAGVAHDLNNALSPILMVVSLLHTKWPGAGDQRLLDIIDESAKHAADMVKQVLTFARGREVERMVMKVGLLLDEISAIIQHTFPKSIHLVTDVAPDIWSFFGNSTQLHQVLLNLCVNARDAMPEGGTLTVTVANIQLEATHDGMVPEGAPGPYVRLIVADTGTGMSMEVQEHIFEPFYTTKTLEKGTGLGLSTVRKIVEAHQGFLQVRSELGRGTEFHIYLPAQLDAEPAAAEFQQAPPPIGGGERILVVDDEASIRNILTLILETSGYRVDAATDGPQAVAMCARDPARYRLLITDMAMPMMDGPATIMAVRTIVPHIKIIATSGTKSLGMSATSLDTQGFLTKPYSAEEVLRMVHAVLHPEIVAE
jgi:nitrogen-specific signal transduction histidine kinase